MRVVRIDRQPRILATQRDLELRCSPADDWLNLYITPKWSRADGLDVLQ